MPKQDSFFTPTKVLFFLSILISIIGLIFVFESSVAEAFYQFGNQYYFVRQQSIRFVLGIIVMLIASIFPIKFWKELSPLIYIFSIFLLILVFIPGIGKEINGAHRWFVISGATFQPVELVKLGVIFFFADWMSKHQRIAPFLFLTGLPSLLLLLQPDLGSTLVLVVIAFGMYFLAGGSVSKLSWMSLAGIILVGILIISQPYRMRRLTTFINPESDPLGASFHIRQITIALGNGGWLGQGVGRSKQKFSYIPEASTDSIFAIVAEELGFIGSFLIIILFLAYLQTGYKIMIKQKVKSFEFLLAGGILLWFSAQTLLNLSAVVALVPLTGLPLPLFSFGGSSLIMVLLATGILIAIGKQSS